MITFTPHQFGGLLLTWLVILIACTLACLAIGYRLGRRDQADDDGPAWTAAELRQLRDPQPAAIPSRPAAPKHAAPGPTLADIVQNRPGPFFKPGGPVRPMMTEGPAGILTPGALTAAIAEVRVPKHAERTTDAIARWKAETTEFIAGMRS